MRRSFLLVTLASLLASQAPQEPAHVKFFQAVPGSAQKGGTVTLRWAATGLERVRLEPLGVELPAEGEMQWPVQGRIVFWLNAINLRGGQSIPLVVEPLPEPAPALPAQLQFLLGAVPGQPAVPAPGAAAPAPGHGRAWIQFASMTNPLYADRLRRNLLPRVKGLIISVSERARDGQVQKRMLFRAGPYRSLREARQRMAKLVPVTRALHIRPVLVMDPPPG